MDVGPRKPRLAPVGNKKDNRLDQSKVDGVIPLTNCKVTEVKSKTSCKELKAV